MARKLCIVIGIAIFLVSSAYAQEQKSALSLDDCISMALSYYPSITAARESVESARADKAGSVSGFLPILKAGYSHTWLDEAPSMNFQGMKIPMGDDQIDTYTFSATQPITSIWTAIENYRLKGVSVDVEKIKSEMAVQDLILRVKQAYFGLLRAKRFKEVASESVNLVQALVDNSKRFYEVGLIAKNELLIAEVKLAEAKQQLVRAEHSFVMAQSALNSLIGQELNTPVDVLDIEEKEALFELDERKLQEEASRNRLEILEIEKSVKMAQISKGLALSQMFPEFFVSAEASHTEGTRGDPDEKVVIFGASWTFGDWGKRYFAHRSALHSYKQALAAKKLIEKQVELDVRQSYLKVIEAKESIEVSQKAIEQAEENFRIIQKKFDVQAATSTDVLDAQTALTSAKLNYYSALYDYELALAALERAIGKELNEAIKAE